jgi:hypothetical protein
MLFGKSQGREKQGGQNRDDGDDDQQFNEGESAGMSERAPEGTGARRKERHPHGTTLNWELVFGKMAGVVTSVAVMVTPLAVDP